MCEGEGPTTVVQDLAWTVGSDDVICREGTGRGGGQGEAECSALATLCLSSLWPPDPGSVQLSHPAVRLSVSAHL